MDDATEEPVSFEHSLCELEKIVRALENGDIGLEESLAQYENGVGLLKRCFGMLQQAEQRIQTLTGETIEGQAVTKRFEHAATRKQQARSASRGMMFGSDMAVNDLRHGRSRLPSGTFAGVGSGPARQAGPTLECYVDLVCEFTEYLRSKQTQVDGYLATLFTPAGGEVSPLASLRNGCPARLAEAMRYSLLAGGKRLRPILVLMANEAAGGSAQRALPAAAAVEMIHTYSLIHDDLPAMDDDDLRRGRPTCHKVFGEALAILAGDALLTLAFDVLASNFPPATAAACCRELSRGAGAAGMVGGQVEDLACQHQGGSLDALKNVHARKTGALFRSCLHLGILAAQGERSEGPDGFLVACLDGYGKCFGMIFQITDDLIDVESSAEQTGKRTHKDAAHGKLTYPGFLGLEESRRHAQELAAQARRHLEPLGNSGNRLEGLLQFTLARDR